MSLFDFSSQVLQNIGLTEISDREAYKQAVDTRLDHLKEATYTHLALKEAREKGFIGARDQVPRTVVLVTDGDPTIFYLNQAYSESDLIRAEGIDLVIIAIGQSISMDKMLRMVDNDTSKVISVGAVTDVQDVLATLANSICTSKSWIAIALT
jgi:hypothetical protein